MKSIKRCPWPSEDLLMIEYHDTEWGVPVHDDRLHFEYMILDGFQAGLSWKTILHKRENFREAFHNFEPERVVKFGKREIEKLMKNEGIIRNRLKVQSAVTNAREFLKVQKEFNGFDPYIWQFTSGKMINRAISTVKEIPATSEESDAMSKDLKKRGFKFVGSTICYAYMQAAGMVNDHEISCFRHKQCLKLAKAKR
jgi:DNA-3-methyladenine glycosylase I